MECFLLPSNPTHSLVEIPCLSETDYYGLLFSDYADRQGFNQYGSTANIHVWFQAYMSFQWNTFGPFLQQWLCFGLLSSLFDAVIPVDSLTRLGVKERRVLCTADLNGQLSDFIDTERMRTFEEREEKNEKMNGVLSEINSILRAYSSCLKHSQRACSSESFQEDSDLLLFLSLLYEKVAAVAQQAYTTNPRNFGSRFTKLGLGYVTQSIGDKLATGGWCQQHRWDLFKDASCSFGYFVSHLGGPGMDKNHRGCQMLSCTAYDISESNYQVKHKDVPCDGRQVEVRSDELVEVLQRGKIPALVFENHAPGKRRVKVVAVGSHTPYIAFSHVWSDGFGNPTRNAMCACQITYLFSMSMVDGEYLPIWIDTLCCPHEPYEARKLAISLMRKTYQEAHTVIVVDSWLSEQRFDSSSAIEMLIKMSVSGWMCRLWTYQEGCLSRRLFVKLMDELVSVAAMLQGLLGFTDPAILPLKAEVILALTEISGSIRDFGTPLERLIPLCDTLRLRSTTVASDEAICIASVLQLDIEAILTTPANDRMVTLWKLLGDLGGIMQDVVFLGPMRLGRRGFRGLPGSLLGTTKSRIMDRFIYPEARHDRPVEGMNNRLPVVLASLNPDGINLRYDGFILGSSLGLLIHHHKAGRFEFVDGEGMLYFVEIVSTDYQAAVINWTFDPSFSEADFWSAKADTFKYNLSRSAIALIVKGFHGKLHHEDASPGILASFIKQDEKFIFADFICHVIVYRAHSWLYHPGIVFFGKQEPRPVNALTARYRKYCQYSKSPAAGMLFYGEKRQSQNWCLDGPSIDGEPSQPIEDRDWRAYLEESWSRSPIVVHPPCELRFERGLRVS